VCCSWIDWVLLTHGSIVVTSLYARYQYCRGVREPCRWCWTMPHKRLIILICVIEPMCTGVYYLQTLRFDLFSDYLYYSIFHFLLLFL
jgi:hypothetical protein